MPVIAAYNLWIARFFVLNGMTILLFVPSLVRESSAALLGSANFIVTAFGFGHIKQYQLLPTFWYPLSTRML